MPIAYLHDRLAQRWGIDPERLEELEPETILRGLTFLEMEASAKVTETKP